MWLTFTLSQRLNNLTQATKTQVNGFKFQQVLLAHNFFFVNFFATS